METKPHELTVFIIASHPFPIFKRCLQSALAALPERAEILVFLNGPQPEKQVWLESLNERRLRFETFEPSQVTLLRNRSFSMARGRILHFMDDDVLVPHELFRKILQNFGEDPMLSVLGGPNLTPIQSTPAQKLFGAALSSPSAAPFVFARYSRIRHKGPATSLHMMCCNLAIRLADLPRHLRFHDSLYPNDEVFFIDRARRMKRRAVYDPECYVYHERRRSLLGFLKQIAGYGRGRGMQTLMDPLTLPLSLLMLALSLIGVFSLLEVSHALLIYVMISIVGWSSSPEGRRTGLFGLLAAPFLTFAIHGCYLFGIFQALSGECYCLITKPVQRLNLTRFGL